jgi:acetyl-CoA carboxylase biotin carboxyl carrier protein
MATLDLETVRTALTEARSRGFAEVEVRAGDDRFRASLLPGSRPRPAPSAGVDAPAADEERLADVKAKLVGWFRADGALPQIGDRIEKGQKIGGVDALGIVTDLEADAAGEVVEVLVAEGDKVQYGQAVLRVRP